LTGVQAFLRSDLEQFCREAPPEFTDHQRQVFCVFSGQGVGNLRRYLNDNPANEELLTMSDDEEDDETVDGEERMVVGAHPGLGAGIGPIAGEGDGEADGEEDDEAASDSGVGGASLQ
jgi:F-box and leucine-rich repeat protein GRR1